MKNTLLLISLWFLAIIITLAAATYQRKTGPTYPKKITTNVKGIEYESKLIRSHGGETDAPVTLSISDENITAKLKYKIFPPKKDEEWIDVDFAREQNKKGESVLVAKLPYQPPAGKLMYYIEINNENKVEAIFKEEPIVIRFKGDVPAGVLIPHIFFMFFAMMFANVAGLFAIAKRSKTKLYTTITFFLMLVGGMILGPVVQKYAFLEYWAGVPFGWDLTDNKMLIAFVFWLIAFVGNFKADRKYLTIIASIVTLIIFSIPHSMYGSELDRETGEVIQGFINLIPFF